MTKQSSFSITDLLNTPQVVSASNLLDFFKSRPNEFFTKKMLIDYHGFSSNIGKNLTDLTTRDEKAKDFINAAT